MKQEIMRLDSKFIRSTQWEIQHQKKSMVNTESLQPGLQVLAIHLVIFLVLLFYFIFLNFFFYLCTFETIHKLFQRCTNEKY